MSYNSDGTSSADLQTTVSRDASGIVTVEERIQGLRATLEALVPGFGPYRLNPIDGTPWAELNIEHGGSLTATEPALTVSYNLKVMTSPAPLEEHPTFAALIDLLDVSEKSQLRRLVENIEEATEVPAFVSGALIDYYELRLNGINNYLRAESVLVSQATYQRGSSFRPNVAAAGVVYQTATVRSALKMPLYDSYLSAKLPIGEWLAEDIDYSSVSTGQRSLTQAFRYATTWDSRLYTHATSGVLVNLG